MNNPANRWERRKVVHVLEVPIWVKKSGIDAVPKELADQFANVGNTTLVKTRGTTMVSH